MDPLHSARQGCATRWRVAIVTSLLPLLAMCTGTPEPRRVAERFIAAHCAEAQVGDAVTLCTGAAKAKLDGELAAMRGMGPVAAADRSHITFRLASESAAGAQAAYVYEIDPRTSDVKPLTAKLALSNEGGPWLVTSITNTASAACSRPPTRGETR